MTDIEARVATYGLNDRLKRCVTDFMEYYNLTPEEIGELNMTMDFSGLDRTCEFPQPKMNFRIFTQEEVKLRNEVVESMFAIGKTWGENVKNSYQKWLEYGKLRAKNGDDTTLLYPVTQIYNRLMKEFTPERANVYSEVVLDSIRH